MHLILYFLLIALLCCTPAKKGETVSAKDNLGWRHISTLTGEIPPPGNSTQQTASLVADIDRDGVNDIVIGCRKAPPSLVWYRRHAGGWQRLVIDSTTLSIEAGGACHDIDSDGDLDLVMGGDASSNRVWWWENPYPDFSPDKPWIRREIKQEGKGKHHDQMFGDFDSDGKAELVFWNQHASKLFLAEIPEDFRNTKPWQLVEIYAWKPDTKLAANIEFPSWMRSNEHEGLAAADIDRDGRLDILGGGRWFRHVEGTTFEVEEIDPAQHFTRAAAGQLKKGGRPEVVFVIGDGVGPIKWYEYKKDRWIGRDLLGHDVWHGHSLQIIDLNRDGNLDVFCAEMRLDGRNPDAKIYAFLGDGQGHFRTVIVAEGYGNHESKAADLDGDGDIDIMGKPYNWETPRLDFWINRGAAFEDTAAVPFEHIIIDEDGPADPHTKTAGDLDGDGTEDLVVASSSGGPLFWYRSPRWTRHEIASSGRWSCDAEVADLDNDGDNDLVISEYYDKNRLEWYENPAPSGDPAAGGWKLHVIGAGRAHDIEVRDLDGDGDLDIISRGQSGFGTEEGNRIVVWRQDGPNSWTQSVIICPHGEGLALGDLDRDSDPDIAISGLWYENPGKIAGPTWDEHSFTQWHQDAVVRVADMNADGRLDVVLTEAEGTSRVCWFEAPPDPAQGGWTEHVIWPSLEKGHSLGVADLDNDGDLDVATAEMHQSENPDEVVVYINQGSALTWRKQVLSNTGSHGIRLGDFDGDGDTDIFGSNWRSVAQDSLAYVELWRNNLGSTAALPLNKWSRHVIDDEKPWRSVFISAGDLDGDGYKDIVTGGWWYPNPGSPGGKWLRRSLGNPLRNMAAIYDFDSDGLLDVLGTTGKGSEASAQFVWARNTGGGRFKLLKNIPAAQGDFLQGIEVARTGPGGPLAVALSWHKADQGIQAFLLPDDPAAEQWSWMKVTDVSQDEQVSVGDIDSDGDPDILLGTLWIENLGESVAVHKLFETGDSPDRNRLADMNGDGRPDAVVGYEAINTPGKLVWYENPLPGNELWTEHLIAEVVGPMSLDVADMDTDGDPDVVVGEHNYAEPETARLFVFQNLDGKGKLWKKYLVHTGDEHHDGAITVDIDSDGDLDIISIGWSHPRVLLYENRAL